MAYGKQWRTELEDGTVITRSNTWSPPGSHPVGYGVKVVTKDNKLIRVEGDDDNPITKGRVNAMNLALREYTHNPARIIYPMKRAREDRGKDKWVRISWDEAIDEICEKVRYFQNTYGPESIVCFGGTGREACIYYYALTFSVLQSPNCCYTQSGWSCYGPRCSVSDYVLGAGYPELDYAGHLPGSYDDPAYTLSKYVVVWGKEPLPSNGDGFFGHCLVDMMKRGTKIISVDPRITWVGARNGNINVQVRPQTDTALALGLINLMFQNDEYDKEFVEKWVYGWEDLKKRAEEYPVEKVSEITTVPVETIERVAHIIGTERPIGFAWGLAFDQNKNGVQLSQAFICIEAMAGAIDRPGGVTLGPPSALLGKWRMEQRGAMTDEVWAKRIGAEQWPGLSTGMATTQPDETLNTLESGKPYKLHMAWFNSSNFLTPTCSAQPKRWHDGLVKLDYVVVQDLFMTPTAMACGDIFLPMSTWAEHDGIVLTHYGRNTVFMGPMNKALQVGECKSDIEVCLIFGQRLNPEWWPWYKPADGKHLDLDALQKGVESFFDDQLKELGMTFEDLREAGIYQPGAHGFEYEKYEKGLLRFDGQPGFNTITGQIEAYSILYESWGEDPLPYYYEPDYSPISKPDLAGQYPLISTSGSRRYSSFHSEHRQVPSLRQIDPWPWVQINPETAKEYGITEGDWVEVYNMFGEARFKAEITPIIKPGIINCAHGWWFPEQDGEEPNLFGVWKSNFNSLVPHMDIGKLGFGAPYKGVMCNMKRVRSLDQD
ncbi:MAG: molybdopterin-dependent oxidoreductase [Eggerthellaceae bacterium]|jgi:anaerobic selenocysteine-containing dehydrogenase